MMKSKKVRLDILLTERGYFQSREKARIAIMEGKVYVNAQREDKPGTMISDDSQVELKGETLKYVSRGGLKLEKAMNVFHIDFKNKLCIDIGSSTGGFTDLMLQNGARKVIAIDSGTNQLDYRLRTDDRVVAMENTNARYIDRSVIGEELADIITIDVSFISLTKIIDVASNLLIENGNMIMLIKPQFEAGREKVEKKGVVKNSDVHEEVISKIIIYCEDRHLHIKGLDFSPIKGPAGNIEFLLYVGKSNLDSKEQIHDFSSKIKETVERAHIELA